MNLGFQKNKKIIYGKLIANKEWLIILSCLFFLLCLLISQGYFNHFFDHSKQWMKNGYIGQDQMSLKQYFISFVLLILIVYFSIYLRRKTKEQIFFVYKVLWIILVILEIAKIFYSNIWCDIFIYKESFSWNGVLPFYTCSMILWFLPFVIWTRGLFQQYCIVFFSTIGIAAGLSNFIYLSAAGYYPLFSYGCCHSYFYHSGLVFVGLSLIINKIFVLKWRNFYYGLIPLFIFAIPAIVANYVIYYKVTKYVDYLLLVKGNEFGFFGQWSKFLWSKNLGFIFMLFVLFVVYPTCVIGMMVIDRGIIFIMDFCEKMFNHRLNNKKT